MWRCFDHQGLVPSHLPGLDESRNPIAVRFRTVEWIQNGHRGTGDLDQDGCVQSACVPEEVTFHAHNRMIACAQTIAQIIKTPLLI